jgi:hypothetical protein
MASIPLDRTEVLSALKVLKYFVVEVFYRLIGWLVLRREQFVVACQCGCVRNVEVPSYRGSFILESGYWARFRPKCAYCGESETITATRTGKDLGWTLHRLPGYTKHAE